MIGLILAILFAALAYWICTAVGLPWIVGVIVAVLVILAGWRGGLTDHFRR